MNEEKESKSKVQNDDIAGSKAVTNREQSKSEIKKMNSNVGLENNDKVKMEVNDANNKSEKKNDKTTTKAIEAKGVVKDKAKQNKDKNASDSSHKKYQKQNSSSKNKNQTSSDENEYIEKLVSINRVAKVVKGGRRFSFAALVVVGDGNGMVGHGKGKAKEVPEAIKKATDEAKENLIRVPLRQARTLHHDITGRYDAGRVHLRSAPSGTGVIAGGPMRAVFEALGIKDIVAKSVGSSNPHNMVRATFNALSTASSPKLISLRRGLKVNEITKRRKGAQTLQETNPDG